MNDHVTQRPPHAAAPETSAKASAAKPRTRASQQRRKPAGRTKPQKAHIARRGSKTAKILRLLERPGGASVAELRKVTGWQAHSVRGFLSGTLKKKMGLRVHSDKAQHGERVYRVAAK